MGKKKEKVVFVDDGRTLADMSNVGSRRLGNRNPSAPRPKAGDVWSTYWNAVKMMFLPMLATIGGICVIFGILYLIFGLA